MAPSRIGPATIPMSVLQVCNALYLRHREQIERTDYATRHFAHRRTERRFLSKRAYSASADITACLWPRHRQPPRTGEFAIDGRGCATDTHTPPFTDLRLRIWYYFLLQS